MSFNVGFGEIVLKSLLIFIVDFPLNSHLNCLLKSTELNGIKIMRIDRNCFLYSQEELKAINNPRYKSELNRTEEFIVCELDAIFLAYNSI